nr:MAG: hypothetical protein [Longquan rodent ribovirus 1]WOK58435.1 MAG: hypothetical protein [Longquan rodent ribovirus 1]WPV62217.1 MAG: hypothetical protein [Wenzhou rodent hepe-like virus 1]
MTITLAPDRQSGRQRAYDDDTGAQTIRGGQFFNEGILSAIPKAYANLVYHPIALVVLVFSVAVILAASAKVEGPLEYIRDFLHQIIIDDQDYPFVVNIAHWLLTAVVLMINHKVTIFYCALACVPAIVKPSSRNLVISSLAVVFILVSLRSLTPMGVLVASQIYYLIVMVRSPLHKIILVILFFLFFFTNVIPAASPHVNNTVYYASTLSSPIVPAHYTKVQSQLSPVESRIDWDSLSDDAVRSLAAAGLVPPNDYWQRRHERQRADSAKTTNTNNNGQRATSQARTAPRSA